METILENIKETQNEIYEVEITIQNIRQVQDKYPSNSTIKQELNNSISNLETHKQFLEQIKNDDEQHLEFKKCNKSSK